MKILISELQMGKITETEGWGNSKKKLEKTFSFSDFNTAIKFVNKVARIAEKQNHHPKIIIDYNEVTVSITDHEAGKVSDKCIKFVNAIDKI